MSSPKLKTALLVIDLQQEFTTATEHAIPNVLKLSKYFLDHNLLQVFIQDTDVDRPVDSNGFKLIPSIHDAYLATKPTAPPLVKTLGDSFAGTTLEATLK